MKLTINAERLYKVLDSGRKYRDEALINIDEKGIMTRMHEESNTSLYSAFIPKEAAEEFEVGEFPRIGVNIDKVLDFIPNKDETITVEIVESAGSMYKLQINVGTRQYKLGIIDPDSVNGVPDQIPTFDHCVSVTGELSMIMGFVQDYGKGIGDSKDGGVYISPRDGVINLWGSKDDFEIRDVIHYEDFEDYSIDWSKGSEGPPGSLEPEKDRGCDSVISYAYLDLTQAHTDTVKMEFDNHYPMKIVSDWDCGIKQSWIIPPRIPSDDEHMTIPEEVEQQRELVSSPE